MMVNGDKRATLRRLIEQSGLPAGPLMMPDQVLVREKKSFRLRPFIQWLAVR